LDLRTCLFRILVTRRTSHFALSTGNQPHHIEELEELVMHLETLHELIHCYQSTVHRFSCPHYS
jgi:hypothetical protein